MRAKPPRRRPDKVAEVVRQVIAEALILEVRDPRVRGASVTRVRVTADLSQASVGIVMRGTEDEQAAALDGLRSAAGFLRGKVARVLTARTTPELSFQIDRGLEHAAHIDRLLANLRQGGGS